VDRWRKRNARLSPAPADQLSQFRSLYERGEMSREEFERVKALLAGQLRQDLNVPAPPRAEGAAPPGAITAAPPPPPPPREGLSEPPASAGGPAEPPPG
jgi:hypothetical protein